MQENKKECFTEHSVVTLTLNVSSRLFKVIRKRRISALYSLHFVGASVTQQLACDAGLLFEFCCSYASSLV